MAKIAIPYSNAHKKMNEKLYFCPHCRVFFLTKEQYVNSDEDSKSQFDYKCFKCSKFFNPDTYKEEARNGQNYHFEEKTDREKISAHIKKIVLDLYQEGYSHREIHQITHFSRTTVAEITKENIQEKRISIEEFCMKNLRIKEEDYEAILYKKTTSMNQYPLPYIVNRSIDKALEYGCTIRQVSKLFKVSNKTIYNTRGAAYRKVYKKHKIKIDNKGIILVTIK